VSGIAAATVVTALLMTAVPMCVTATRVRQRRNVDTESVCQHSDNTAVITTAESANYTKAEVSTDSDQHFQINSHLDPDVYRIAPKCCGFIALSVSVISPSFVNIGR